MIFYFTGTGNTRWAAQQLAEATEEELRYIPDELKNTEIHYALEENERLGFCFPTHGWQPPRIVREFIRRATFSVHRSTYIYAFTTCGDNMGYAMRIFEKELQQKGLHTDARFAVVMPESNVCFSFLHLDTDEKARQKVETARQRMTHICQVVKERQQGIEELVKGAIPFTYTYVIGGYYNKHLITDEKFRVDKDACIQCGLCEKLCPVDDIKGTPPVWLHNGRCTNCLACYHHCPAHAIHWGNMKRGQYLLNKLLDRK
jgi:ferredoxin